MSNGDTPKRMTVGVTLEPKGYHPDGETWVGIHLAFEELPPAANSDYVAKQLQTAWKFFAYELVDDQTLSLISGVNVSSPHYPGDEAERSVAASAVSAWLKRRVPEDPLKPFADLPPETVDLSRLRPIDLQHAAAGWDAPVPHWAGLTHVVKIDSLFPNDHSKVYFIPIDGVAPSEFTVGSLEEEVLTISVGGATATQATLYPIPHQTQPSSAEPFLTLPKNPSETRRFSDALEAHAFTLMNVHAVLMDAVETWAADPPTNSLNEDQLKSLQVVSQNVALDPLRIALLSSTILGNGISPATRDGFLLADLVRRYEKEVLSQTQSPHLADDIEAFRQRLRVRIQDQLASSNVETLLDSCYKASDRPTLSSPLTLQTVMQQNRALAAWIASEKGVEDILATLVTGLPKIPGDDAQASPFTTAVSAYLELIRGSFNGADAVRHEVGYVVQSLVLPQLRGKSVNEVTTSLKNADWCSTRLRGVAGGGEISFANISPRILPDNALNAPNLAVLSSGVEKAISEAWTTAVESIISSQNVVRFQPDSAPAPLSIRIASSPQADADLDQYTENYNGVGIVIRRERQGQERADQDWAHANLVELAVPPKPSTLVNNHDAPIAATAGTASEPDAKTFPAAIRAFLPVAVDGRRQLDLDYRGYPLGSPAFSATDAPDVNARDNLIPGEAFYVAGDVDYTKADLTNFMKPPKLAYGDTYEWAAYHVTKAGSLPSQLQASPQAPWQPIGRIDLGSVASDKDKVVRETYRRRTAIGAVTFGMQAGQPSRIGKSYSDVEPLAIDAPRVCVTPKTFVDLFRGSDGRGELPNGSTVTFDDIRSYGGGAVSLNIEIHTDSDATSDAAAGGSPISVQIPGGAGEVHIKHENSWLRFRLPDGGADTSVTFPHPTVATSEGAEPVPGGSHRRQPPVLLIAEKNREWLGEVSEPALIECALSSVSYLDWEHWTNNASLKVCGIDRTEANFKNAPGTMLLASLTGGLDETGTISKLVQRLPDPSVIRYVIELAVVDDVVGDQKPPHGVVWQTYTNGNGLLAALDKAVVLLQKSLDPLRNVLKGVDQANRLRFEVKSVGAEGTLAIRPLGTNPSTDYTVTVPAGVVARLAVRPIVADESVDVGLNNPSDRPIHSGLRQWAIGTEDVDGTKGLVFEGTELFLEAAATFVDPKQIDKLPLPERRELLQTIYEEIYQPLRKQVSLKPGGPSRRYDIALEQKVSTKPWARLFSYVDIATQRWRFSGRPIYHWYRPVSDGTSSVVWVDKPIPPQDNSEWPNFETELFFDRDDVDCDTRRARIGIGGPILQTIHWDNPSATWFRHGCTFVSRYRGLLKTGGRGDRLGPPSGAPWTHRAAMLADSARLTLTRPQVRCHVPLSRAPDEGTTPGETPPLACILEERPFAVGGLAERMLAEVAINPGYAFLNDKSTNGTTLGPLDVGREIGRDPRLETWSWMPHRDPKQPDVPIDDPTAQLVLFTEGPVGLHFEQASSPAPAWPNCQYLLRPASLDGGVFVPDETFVGVRMRRALDPAWVVGNDLLDSNAAAPPPFPRQSVKWIEWNMEGLQKTPTLLTLKTDDPGRPEVPVVCGYRHKVGINHKPGIGTFTIDRNLIDPQGGSGEIILCQIPLYDREALTKAATATTFKSIVVLHSGAGDGRHVLSILGIPEATDNIAAGRSNAPVVLATVPWVVPKNAETFGLAIGGKPTEVFPLLSSEPTFLEWARTARDAATLYHVDDSAAGATAPQDDAPQGIHERTRPFSLARSALPILVTDIEAISNVKNNSASLEFRRRFSGGPPTWIAPPLSVSLQPLGVQRHLVGLFTLPTVEPGRRIDQFRGACRLIGSNPIISQDCSDATAVRIAELEIPAVTVGSGHPARIPTGTTLQSGEARQFRLHIRFANSPASMASIKDLKVTVAWVVKDNGNYVKYSATFTPLSGTPEKFVDGVRAVDIVWITDNKSAPKPATAKWHAAPFAANPAALQCHLVDGKATVWTPESVTAGAPLGIEVSVSRTSEVWADVSLLHSSVKDPSGSPEYFDFDWLFTPLLDTDDDPSVRLNAASLSGLTDAQARIVSISPPIKIHAGS